VCVWCRMRCLSFLRLKLFKLLVYQNRQNFKTVQQHFLKVRTLRVKGWVLLWSLL